MHNRGAQHHTPLMIPCVFFQAGVTVTAAALCRFLIGGVACLPKLHRCNRVKKYIQKPLSTCKLIRALYCIYAILMTFFMRGCCTGYCCRTTFSTVTICTPFFVLTMHLSPDLIFPISLSGTFHKNNALQFL